MKEIITYAILDNRWLWGHILLGGLGARLLQIWFKPSFIVGIVFLAGLIWEIGEYLLEDLERIYGTRKRFYLDALGDLIGEVSMAIIVIL
ncbi:hypothetical protein HYR99_09840 [Candidatus Poribacteria bacterium]|nr:hypothetical protein [Candidatus Poribacteria bacterium]